MTSYRRSGVTLTVLIALLFGISRTVYCQQDSQGSRVCEPGFFGINCTGVCHCLNGPYVCDTVEGICTDYICDRGWNDSPYCQTPCEEGLFGVNCEDQCHCPEGDLCNKVNGLCSNGSCDSDWTGPGCQIRLPKLTSAPVMTNITCNSFILRWQSWTNELDIGDEPIGPYTVQQSLNSSSWVDIRLVSQQNDDPVMSTVFRNADQYTFYAFRIRANRMDYGKVVWGIPGPSSEPLRLLDACYEPTTAPPTTTTTTTVSTTTVTTTTTSTTSTSQPTTVTTTTTPAPTTLPSPPAPVTNISIMLDDQGNAIITWLPPIAVPPYQIGYNMTYQVVGIGDCNETYREPAKTIKVSSSDRRTIIRNLDPWRKYRFTIVAYNDGGPGQAAEREFLSKEIAPTGKASNVRVSRKTSRTLDLTWNDVICEKRGGVNMSYEVFVKKDDANIQFLTSDVPEAHVSALLPYSNYTIQVRPVNKVDRGPLSDELHVETLEDVPGPPRNVRVVKATNTTLKLSWDVPKPSNGAITQYKVVYWRTGVEGTETSLTVDAVNGTQTLITGLKPFTSYNIRVQARTRALTNDGWGSRSDVITYMTEAGIPSAPNDLRRTFRNESCLAMAWKRPTEQNGIIIKYKVSYSIVARRSVSKGQSIPIEEEIRAVTLSYLACSLEPAAQYRFLVRASTAAGFGEAATLDSWTEVGIPDIPPTPVVRRTAWTNITILIQPVILTRGPVSGYFVVVERISEDSDTIFDRRRREATLPDPVGRIPLPGSTVAYLEREGLLRARTFVVGDGQTYGGYFNSRLTPGALYNIYFVVASSLDGSTKMSFSQIQAPVRAIVEISTTTEIIPNLPSTSTASTTTATTPPSETTEVIVARADNTQLIVAIVLPLILVIILVLILVYFFVFRKRKAEDDKMKLSWLNYYNNVYDTAAKKAVKPLWSDIYELGEPRHVTVNEQNTYMPDDLKVTDIHHNKPKISFDEEYRHLPQGKEFASTAAERPENADKNRFEHILPYDHSRVKLGPPSPSDYINASRISGYDSEPSGTPSRYIAAQSPFNDRTIADFWFMVYQERCLQIVFLANLEEDGIVKSEQYWPNDGEETQYELVAVRARSTDYFANFIVRTFELRGQGSRTVQLVRQYHFTSWPDHGVPRDPIPFLDFRMKVRTGDEFGVGGPMVVHCGTGVSRTAVFIAVDSLLDQARFENRVNVFRFCKKMRKSRTMMVRTLKQYRFIYDSLLEALLTNYNVVGDDLKVSYRLLSKINPITDKSLFREQFEVLEEFTPALTEDQCKAALSGENLMKNRFKSIVPPDEFRPLLLGAGGQGKTDYINAVYVDSYTLEKAFIVTQTPLTSTVVDFWQLVYDYDINCIVMLNGSDFKEDTCADYLPPAQNMQQKYDSFFVRLDDVIQSEHVTLRTVRLSNADNPSRAPRVIKQFQFEAWKMYEKTPWARESFLAVIEMVNQWLEESNAGDSPILVHCMDGASHSGLFCACSVVCEKMLLEGEVDIFHTIKHMKRRRKHFVNNLEQYKFCFKLLWDYMNTHLRRNTLANGDINLAFDTGSDQQLA